MRKTVRCLSLLLALLMCLSLLPLTALAEEAPALDGAVTASGSLLDRDLNPCASWSLDSSGKLTISGHGEVYSDWDDYKKSIRTVVIGSGMSSIGDSAFSDCTALTSVTIPDTVSEICSSAFYNCTALTSVSIPGSVTIIDEGAFWNCTALQSVTLSEGLTSIGARAFQGCSSLKSIALPSSVTTLLQTLAGYYGNCGVFADCTSLTTVTLSPAMQSIPKECFYNCRKLQSVTIPSGVQSIGENAFYNCIALTSASIPDSVSDIGDGAFQGCASLKTIAIPQGVMTLGNCVFQDCAALTSATIADSVFSMGDNSFEGCKALKSVTLPSELVEIGVAMFQGCAALTGLTIPSHVTAIREQAFQDCSALTGITIPGEVTTIGYYAFHGCKALTSVVIPAQVTTIEYRAFEDCTELTSITLPLSLKTLGSFPFPGGEQLNIYYAGTEAQWNDIDGIDYVDEQVTMSFRASGASQALATPVFSAVSNTSAGVKLSWNAVSGAERYRIFRDGVEFTETTAVGYADENVYSGHKYTYYIRAITADGKYYTTPRSAEKSIVYVAQPALPKASVAESGVKLTWNSVDLAEKYYLFRKTDSEDWSKLTETAACEYLDETVVPGTTYYYTLRAGKGTELSSYNAAGTSITYTLLYQSLSDAVITLSETEYTYNGEEKTPEVTVTLNGEELTEGEDYTVKYGKNKNAGTAKVRVTGIGAYTDSKTANFTIKKAANKITVSSTKIFATYSAKKAQKIELSASAKAGALTYTITSTDNSNVTVNKKTGVVKLPKGFTGTVTITISGKATKNYKAPKDKTVKVTVLETPTITSITSGAAKKLTAKWSKVAGASGYELEYTKAKKFATASDTVTVKKTAKTLSKLSAGKTYRVRVRAYKTLKSGETVYSAWSKVETVKIMK